MAIKLFLDTWGWLALHDKSEARHQEIVEFYTAFRSQNGIIFTTDYVLDETFTLLFKRLPTSQAKRSMETLTTAFLSESFNLEWITAERFARAQGFRLKFLDKPQISFTDLTSMVVMDELDIEQVLTGDAHFIQVGMGFQRVP
jgi:predicted nucleic acid-binding protein